MKGGCYCGALRYEISADPLMKAQCHCRECQYISGGGPNVFMVVHAEGFAWTSGAPAAFTRADLAAPVTREFCAHCGTHVVTRRRERPVAIVKVGTLDDPAAYGGPDAAIFMKDAQPFHQVAEGLPCFDAMPPVK